MILALDTATDVCSVAFMDAEGKVHEKRTDERGSHSERLFLFIRDLMHEHSFTLTQLKTVLVSEGPGSYTGLRIAASAVKGLLFQSNLPLYGVNTLASFAQSVVDQVPESGSIHSIIDARRVHFYHQQFKVENGRLSAVSEVKVIPIKEFETKVRANDAIVGTGADRIDEKTKSNVCLYGQDCITGRSLIRLFKEDDRKTFVHSVSSEVFEPRYYTSSQVS